MGIALIIVVFLFAALLVYYWYTLQHYVQASAELRQSDLLTMIQKKDERIIQLDSDYKSLVESYLRETGKVYVRPAGIKPDHLEPAQPSPWRMKPPPPMPVTRAK